MDKEKDPFEGLWDSRPNIHSIPRKQELHYPLTGKKTRTKESVPMSPVRERRCIRRAGYIRHIRGTDSKDTGLIQAVYRGRTIYIGGSYITAKYTLIGHLNMERHKRAIKAARRDAICNWVDQRIGDTIDWVFNRFTNTKGQ